MTQREQLKKKVLLHKNASDSFYLIDSPDGLPMAIRRNKKVYLLGQTQKDTGYVALVRKGEGTVLLDAALVRYCLTVHIFIPVEPIRVKGVVKWL